MQIVVLKRKLKKGIALLCRFIRKPAFTYDDFFQFEFEKKKGIVTRGYIKESELGIPLELTPKAYMPGGSIYLSRVLKKLKINENDSGIDLGCGLGSVMFYMAKFPFKRISGIEFSYELSEGCKNNLEKLNDSRLNLFYGDAGEFDSFDDYNYIFMFNPFGLEIIRKVINNISKSYKSIPRIITLIYKNPVYDNEILEYDFFHKIFEYKTESPGIIFIVYTTE